ncbi:extracellular matrix protein 2 [Diretmus argenteus]
MGRPAEEEKRLQEDLTTVSLSSPVSLHIQILCSGQCKVNGMVLFEGAMWSPQPCTACQCHRGNAKCQPMPCAAPIKQQSTTPTSRRLDDKDSRAVESRKILQGRSRGTQEIKKKEERMLVKPLTPVITVKPVAAKKTKPEVPVKMQPRGGEALVKMQPRGGEALVKMQPRGGEALVKMQPRGGEALVKMQPRGGEALVKMQPRGGEVPARPLIPAVKLTKDSIQSSDEDDYDDPDSDDDDDVVGPPWVRATARPILRATLRPVTARRPVPAPAAPGRPVVTFPKKPSFMESLPHGCLLSDSLIACGSTGLAHMPIITDLGLKTLYLADNKISKIPPRALAGLPNLEWLDLSKNKLDDSSISPLLFQNLPRLRRLILDGNNLTKVPAFLPPSLVELKINDNKLSGLTPTSFKGLSKLLNLELEDNHFHDGNVSPLTFRPLKKLIYLRLEDNKFRAIPSGLPATLQELHLSDNKIEVVHAGLLNKTVNLRVLDLSHNRIREDRIAPRAWIHLMKLESLDLSHNRLVHMPSFLPVALRHLTVHHNQIVRIPGYVFGHMRPGLDSLHVSHNRLQDDGVDALSFLGLSASLSELLLDHNLLQSIPPGLLQLNNLQLLRLNHNYISYVPMNALCDTRAPEDSPLMSVHLQYNLIQRYLIPPTAFSCIRNYHSVLLHPQRLENQE